MNDQSLTLEEISRLGEKYYNEELREPLEKEHMGKYAVIDVENKKYEIDTDRLKALEKAQKVFGEKVFYIIQVGANKNPSVNFSSKKDYAWNF